MKFILPFAALAIGILAQQNLQNQMYMPYIAIKQIPSTQNQIQGKNENIAIPEKVKATSQIKVDDQIDYQERNKHYSDRQTQVKEGNKRQHEKSKHENALSDHNKQRKRGHSPKQNRFYDQEYQVNQQYEYENQYQDEERRSDQHGKRHWKKGRVIKHVLFLVIFAIISLALIRKCIKKRRANKRSNTPSDNQMLNNPNLIDQELNKNYAQIQRLNRLKHEANRRIMRQQQHDPIIYHQPYPHNQQFSFRSGGRIINQNYLSSDMSQNPYPQIPIGRPIPNQRCNFQH